MDQHTNPRYRSFITLTATIYRCAATLFKPYILFVLLSVSVIYLLFKRQKDIEIQLDLFKNEQVVQREETAVRDTTGTTIASVPPSNVWRGVQDRAKDTVVQIMTQAIDFDWLQPYRTPAQGTLSGTGFFINEDGEILTNAHVVEQATAIWVQIPSLGKRIIDAKIVSVSPERDLALLQIDENGLELIRRELGGVPFLLLGDSDLIRRSDEVLALGYPLGQQSLKSTTGVVSGREQHLIQTSAAINPGNSGGPLLNARGEVVGINEANVPSAQNVGYAIPINELKSILPEMRKKRLLRKPFLGVLFNNGTPELTEYLGNPLPGGAYVVEVVKSSALERAGVASGDMLYEINGHKVDPFGEMSVAWSEDKISIVDYVSCLSVGQPLRVVIYRFGERKELNFTFDMSEIPAVTRVYPSLEKIDYEVFGGMVVMQLTKNHIQLLANQAQGLAKYSEIRYQNTPTLVITHIFPNSQLFRCRNVATGSTINEVNSMKVGTLEELRQALKKGTKNQMLTMRVSDNVTRASDNILVVLPWKKIIEEESHLAQCYHYPISATTRDLMACLEEQHRLSDVLKA